MTDLEHKSILDPISMAKGIKYADWSGFNHVGKRKALGVGSSMWMECGKRQCAKTLLPEEDKTSVGQIKTSKSRHTAYGQALTRY